MKAKLEFDLDNYEDELEFKKTVSANDAFLALHELDNRLRAIARYGVGIGEGDKMKIHEDVHIITGKESEILEELVDRIRTIYFDVLSDYNVNMNLLE